MSYQNINQYNFARFGLRPYRQITDISLASDEKDYDEEVVFSDYLIAEFNGNRMPLKFDFNNSTTINCRDCGEFSASTIVSENYWNPDGINLQNCTGITEICDVGLTGIDNGLVLNISGETIELNKGLYSNDLDKFSRYKYDSRFKMHPITGFTTSLNRIYDDDSYNYDITYSKDDDNVGFYASLNGGFFQGFYKLQGYDYQVLPERFNWGWSAEFIIRQKKDVNFEVGLNKRYPENIGTFFYLGSRAENKFYHFADGSPVSFSGYNRVTEGCEVLKTCECYLSASSASTSCTAIYPQSAMTSYNCTCSCNCDCPNQVIMGELDPLYDGVSNALSFRLSGETNPRLCVKTYRITGGCETTGSCSTTGITYTTGTSLTEWCSTRGIFDECKDTSYIDNENWVQIDAVFVRDTYLDDCDLGYKGGLKEIVKEQYFASLENNSVSLVIPPLTHEEVYAPPTTDVVNITEYWINEKKYRNGKLKFYVNGKLFYVINNFEEIIPRPLNVVKEKQIGVPFNISLGGGTQGLHDNLTFLPIPECDISCGVTIDLNLSASIFSGSINAEYNLTSNAIINDNIDLTFSHFLGKTSGGYFRIDTSVTIYSGQTTGQTLVTLAENFSELNGESYFDNISSTGVSLTNLSVSGTTFFPTPTPTPTVTQTTTPTFEVTATNTPSLTSTSTVTPTNTISPSQTNTETPTNTPTETESPTPTPTNTESDPESVPTKPEELS